ncbi:MAG: hypothetical protein WD579_01575 [Candidatus Paceibacterota bacterium]
MRNVKITAFRILVWFLSAWGQMKFFSWTCCEVLCLVYGVDTHVSSWHRQKHCAVHHYKKKLLDGCEIIVINDHTQEVYALLERIGWYDDILMSDEEACKN